MNSRRTSICFLTILAIAFFTAVPASAQVTTSPGKLSAYISTPALTVPGEGNKVVATVTILRGHRGEVLEADGLLQIYGPDESVMYILLRANGVFLNGSDPAVDCQGEVACSLVATGWLDLDAAERSNPGKFIGKPLLIEMIAGNARVTVPSVTATLRSRLQSK